jgi:hypothetical protein
MTKDEVATSELTLLSIYCILLTLTARPLPFQNFINFQTPHMSVFLVLTFAMKKIKSLSWENTENALLGLFEHFGWESQSTQTG